MGPHRNTSEEKSAFDFEIVDEFDMPENQPQNEEIKKEDKPFVGANIEIYIDKYKNLKFDRSKVLAEMQDFVKDNQVDDLAKNEEMRKSVIRYAILDTRINVWKKDNPNATEKEISDESQKMLEAMNQNLDAVYNFFSGYSDISGIDMLAAFQNKYKDADKYVNFYKETHGLYQTLDLTTNHPTKQYDKRLNINNEFTKAFFSPKADSSHINYKYASEDTKKQSEEWNKQIEAVEIPVPESLNDNLIEYAVIGEFLKPENLKKCYDIMMSVGGSTLYPSLSPEETSKMILFTNLMGYDKRANAQSPRAILPECRENVKTFIEGNQIDSIKENIKRTAQHFYIESLSKRGDTDEFSYAVNNMKSLMDACERSNITMDEIGMDVEKLERFKAMELKQELYLNRAKAAAELNKAYLGLYMSNGKNPEFDPIKDPTLKGHLLDYMAYNDLLETLSVENNVELEDTRACYNNYPEKLAARPLSPTEKLLVEKPYGTFKAFRDRAEKSDIFKEALKADLNTKLNFLETSNNGISYSSLYNGMRIYFGDWQAYETEVADFDFAQRDKAIKEFAKKADADIVRIQKDLEKDSKNKKAKAAQKAYDAFKKFQTSFDDMMEFRKNEHLKGADFAEHSHAKMMAQKYKEVHMYASDYISKNMGLYLCPDDAKFFMADIGSFDNMANYFENEDKILGLRNGIREAAYKVKSTGSLYSVPANEVDSLKWGISKDQHVTHFFDGDSKDMIEINPNESPENNPMGMDQKSVYNTLSDKKTMESFKQLMKLSAKEFEKPGIDKDYKNVLRAVKTYVTATRRSTQQEAFIDLNSKLATYGKKHKGMNAEAILQFKNTLNGLTNGSLEPDPTSLTGKDTTEPQDAGFGHLGAWRKTDGALFPHEPSPNDIKQGLINDCFMLSALTKLAKDHPEKIKNAIRDNGDGTVSVRFYNKKREGVFPNVTYHKEPVDICVNKTVKKAINGAHIYSSSALWVQMVEKAFAKYIDSKPVGLYKGDEHGFQRMDRGFSSEFMDAFDSDTFYENTQEAFGFSSQYESDLYDLNAPKREGYTQNEIEFFDFFSRTNNGEVMTVGGTTTDKARQTFMKNHGVRPNHAYGVMGTFEKDGKKYIQLRDPYATFEAKYNDKGEMIDNSAFYGNSLKAGSNTMGTFNLEFKDFLKMYNSIPGMTEEAAAAYRHLDREVWLDRRNEARQKQKAEAEKSLKEEKSNFLDDVEIINEAPKDAPKKKTFLDEAEVVESKPNKDKENEIGFLDDAEIVEDPVEKAKRTIHSFQKGTRALINKISNDENLSKEEKNGMHREAVASLLASSVIGGLVNKYGEHMDQEQLESIVNADNLKLATKDIMASEGFKKAYSEIPEDFINMFSAPGNIGKDALKSLNSKFTKYTQEFAKKDYEAKHKESKNEVKENNGFEIINM